MNSTFYTPEHLAEALSLLAESAPPEIIAGGTDLWPKWKAGQNQPQRLLSLHKISALRHIEWRNEHLAVGATCTHSDLVHSPLIHQACPALAAAAKTIGATQIQNRGTIGGNIMNASPAADLPPVLLAANAQLVLTSVNGQRTIPIRQFFTGYRQTARQPQELLTVILIPPLCSGNKEHFRKIGTRQAQAISKVVGCCRLGYDPQGTFKTASIAFGSVGPTVLALPELEQWLIGRQPTTETAEAAEKLACRVIQPIDDLRSSADYRRHVVGRLVFQWIQNEQYPSSS